MSESTVSVQKFAGIPCVIYNKVPFESSEKVILDGKEYEGFYISYNSYDVEIYGCDTTALVLGQMQNFYILNFDHREQYKELVPKGFKACLEYFINCPDKNKNSDLIDNTDGIE